MTGPSGGDGPGTAESPAGPIEPVEATTAVATETDPPTSEDRPKKKRSTLRSAVEWVVVLAIALGVALFVRSYVVQTYFIPSASMEPTLQIGDHILVLKAAYRFTSPAIGDIVVFTAPPAEHVKCSDPEVQDLVKRIVATPGDTIWSVGNQIYLQPAGAPHGAPLSQPWQHSASLGPAITRQVVAPDQYFVMGDNRQNSCDSRDWGTVPRGDIVGKAVFIFWPPSRMGTL